jgi:hypothetical protein
MGSKVDDRLGDAARATEAQGSARILSVRFTAADRESSRVWDQAEGEADFAQRRTHMRTVPTPGSLFDTGQEGLASRHAYSRSPTASRASSWLL